VTSIEPELWVDRAAAAVSFYEAAFGAATLLRVGDGEDIVARLAVGDARFWVAAADSSMGRFSPEAIAGRTSRTLLVVDDPDAVVARAVGAGATEASPVVEEHGWRLGRIVDPHGHEWEVGAPV
jgi:PhnB protein